MMLKLKLSLSHIDIKVAMTSLLTAQRDIERHMLVCF